MERSVRRSDLDSGQGSLSPEPINVDKLKALAFEFVETAQPPVAQDDVAEAETLSFNLFAPTKATQQTAGTQTIRIRSPTPEVREPGFVAPRDHAFYFSSQHAGLDAVTFEDIQQLAKIRWYGSALPWKVVKVPSSGLANSTRQGLNDMHNALTSDQTKRKRKGKKTRIKLRVKLAAVTKKAAETKAAQDSKDAAEREKKTRRNREKQAKKRLRAKVKEASVQEHDTHHTVVEQIMPEPT